MKRAVLKAFIVDWISRSPAESRRVLVAVLAALDSDARQAAELRRLRKALREAQDAFLSAYPGDGCVIVEAALKPARRKPTKGKS